jgi:hypothetical protein
LLEEPALRQIHPMKFVIFAILALVAAALIAGIVIGAVFQLIGYGLMALLVVAAVTFVMKKVRGPRDRLRIHRDNDAERLPR